MNAFQFSEIRVGQTARFLFFIDQKKLDAFRALSGDENPLHQDPAYAKAHGFQEPVVYGQLTAAALSTLAGMYLPGKYSLIHSIETKFLAPVYLSVCPLEVIGTVKDMDDRFKTITVKFEMRDQTGTKVCRGAMRIGFLESQFS